MSYCDGKAEDSRERPATLAERRFAEVRQRLAGLSVGEIFEYIHRNNLWGSLESPSGLGSQLDATASLRGELPGLLERLGVRTLVDIPCGDFSWLSTVRLPIERYIGADIVGAIVAENTERYRASHPWTEFRRLDLTRDPLPEGDALLCRDCLVHLSYASIRAAFGNIVRSGIRYVMMTTFIGDRANTDIEPGDWRPLNFQRPPFSLPRPEAMILEGCAEENGAYADKALGVWPIEQLAGQADKVE